MANKKLGKCFECYCGADYKCGNTERIPRKKKKILKMFFEVVMAFIKMDYLGGELSSCEAANLYRGYKQDFRLIPYALRYKDVIRHIINTADNIAITLDDNRLVLNHYWELDDDFYASSGVMPFIYDENLADETWALDGTKELLERLGIEFGSVKSDAELIKRVYKNINDRK